MAQTHKQALIATALFCNFSLSLLWYLESDKFFRGLLEANSNYSENLLNLKANSMHLSAFEPGVGIFRLPRGFKFPPIKPWGIKPKVPTRPITPAKLKPQPVRINNLLYSTSNHQQVSRAVRNAISNSKRKQLVQTLLNDMPRWDANLLEQQIEADVTAKIQLQLLRANIQTQIQNLTDQGFQELAENYYPARQVSESVLQKRYIVRNGFLTSQDKKDAQLAARQAIEKRNRHKRNFVLSSTTITLITGVAVTSATQKVQGNNSNQRNIAPRSRYPVNRLPKR